jgi:16S rRNA processing protein RimM
MNADLVAVGKITKPHGLRGGLRVAPYFEMRALLANFKQLWLVDEDKRLSHTIEWVRPQGRFLTLKLADVNDVDAAERFRNWEVAVSRKQLPALPEGEHYTFQLVGLDVVTEAGQQIGQIRQVLPMPAHDVYVVSMEDKEVLIPAVKEVVCRVDLDRGQVIIRPLDGLLE